MSRLVRENRSRLVKVHMIADALRFFLTGDIFFLNLNDCEQNVTIGRCRAFVPKLSTTRLQRNEIYIVAGDRLII